MGNMDIPRRGNDEPSGTKEGEATRAKRLELMMVVPALVLMLMLLLMMLI